eukprot:862989-Amphidinium_carterae.2
MGVVFERRVAAAPTPENMDLIDLLGIHSVLVLPVGQLLCYPMDRNRNREMQLFYQKTIPT